MTKDKISQLAKILGEDAGFICLECKDDKIFLCFDNRESSDMFEEILAKIEMPIKIEILACKRNTGGKKHDRRRR